MKHRFLCCLLSILIATLCSGCTATETPDTTDTTALSTTPPQTTETATHYFDDMPSDDYNGWEMFIAGHEPHPVWYSNVCVEELTGESFNDAIYNRQKAVEEKYNTKITELQDTWNFTTSVAAGSGDFSFAFTGLTHVFDLLEQGLCLDLYSLPDLHMENPYWNQNVIQEYTIGGKLYYGMPDINFDQYESVIVLFYNCKLLEDNGFSTSLYDLYQDGDWTIDKMAELMELVTKDVDGDGKITYDKDTLGLVGLPYNALPALHGSGLSLLELNTAKKEYTILLTGEKQMELGEKLKKIYNDTSIGGFMNTTKTDEEHSKTFVSGRALFFGRQIGEYKNLRETDDPYGIIAYPSLDGSTGNAAFCDSPYTMVIPMDCPEKEKSAVLIEALASYTYENIMELYIERTVIGKGARDIESAEILRELIPNRTFELSQALDLKLEHYYYQSIANSTYASTQTSIESSVQKQIESIIDVLSN